MTMLVYKAVILVFLSAVLNSAKCYRILGIFPFASPSHYFLGNALMMGLAEAGHNVTMISPYEQKDAPKRGSYRDVVLTGFREEHENFVQILNFLEPQEESHMEFFVKFIGMILTLNEQVFAHSNVQNFLKSDEKFDLVIVEQFLIDSMKVFGHIYNVPVVAFSSISANPWVNKMVGNPGPPSYIPAMETGFSPFGMTFKQRLINTFLHVTSDLLEIFYYLPKQNEILKRYFPEASDIYGLYYNVSLVLLNSHESIHQPMPSVPNMVQIGGFHVRPPKKLPKDLQGYLDNATEGVVYFSLGSNLKSKDLPPFKRDALLRAFSKLKETVLWKWEEDQIPGKPDNVIISKWFPQQDVLAHPNVKLFITHGGLLSTTETVYHGVPILAIPVFGDQPTNAMMATHGGYALSLPYADPTFSEEKLTQMLQELLYNPKYRDSAKRRSQIFHDRPLKPMDAAVYWVEYVIRNKGAPHLKVTGADLPWYIYHSLDVVGFITVSLTLVVYLLYVTLRKVLYCWGICDSSKRKSKKD